MEYPYHNPVYNDFIINYLGKYRNLETFYLQGHPNSWDDARWNEFTRIIDRLKADGVRFVTISEYLRTCTPAEGARQIKFCYSNNLY